MEYGWTEVTHLYSNLSYFYVSTNGQLNFPWIISLVTQPPKMFRESRKIRVKIITRRYSDSKSQVGDLYIEMIRSVALPCSRRYLQAAANVIQQLPSAYTHTNNYSLHTVVYRSGAVRTAAVEIAEARHRGAMPLANSYGSTPAAFASQGILQRMRSVLG